jgi:hypothetical protein
MISMTGGPGHCVTLNTNEHEFVHPFILVTVYVIVCGPRPANAGSKLFPTTPSPLNVPFGGVHPVIGKGASKEQTDALGLQVTVGAAATKIVNVQKFEHPSGFVYV